MFRLLSNLKALSQIMNKSWYRDITWWYYSFVETAYVRKFTFYDVYEYNLVRTPRTDWSKIIVV